jgi:hypothetical protein
MIVKGVKLRSFFCLCFCFPEGNVSSVLMSALFGLSLCAFADVMGIECLLLVVCCS